MIFSTYDARMKKDLETEIRSADLTSIRFFIQTWIPDYVMRALRNADYSYALFSWDEILKRSFVVGSTWRCFGAYTDKRLDGLLCLSIVETKLKIEFIATAPWNYYTEGKIKRVGTALIFYTIRNSQYTNHNGEFFLNALPDAEKFYESIGMVWTGNVNKADLKEYHMKKNQAEKFISRFRDYVVKE